MVAKRKPRIVRTEVRIDSGLPHFRRLLCGRRSSTRIFLLADNAVRRTSDPRGIETPAREISSRFRDHSARYLLVDAPTLDECRGRAAYHKQTQPRA